MSSGGSIEQGKKLKSLNNYWGMKTSGFSGVSVPMTYQLIPLLKQIIELFMTVDGRGYGCYIYIFADTTYETFQIPVWGLLVSSGSFCGHYVRTISSTSVGLFRIFAHITYRTTGVGLSEFFAHATYKPLFSDNTGACSGSSQ